MPCFNNGCNNGHQHHRNNEPEINLLDRRVYKYSPYPVYPPYPYLNNYNGCCNNGCLPEIRVFENNKCERRDCCEKKDDCEFEDVFKAATIGDEEIFRKDAVPFEFNAFGSKHFIKHYPHDNNFKIEKSALYQVIYKLNFTPCDNGTVSLVLRQNGTPINETLIITQAEMGKYTTITFDDILMLEKDSIIDLQFVEKSTVSAITIVNPYIIFERMK